MSNKLKEFLKVAGEFLFYILAALLIAWIGGPEILTYRA